MNIQEISTVVVAALGIMSGTGLGIKYYADHEYVTISSDLFVQEQNLRRQLHQAKQFGDTGTQQFIEGQLQQLKQRQLKQQGFW